MEWPRLKTIECRVGVVGLFSSGKTVLLTSLVNHLFDHDPALFRLHKPGARLLRTRRVPADDGWAEFHYEAFRDALVHQGRWPAKTRDRFMLACQFEREDWTVSDCLLKLYDLPGERIADAAMSGRDYAAWSDQLLSRWQADTATRAAAAEFLELIRQPVGTETALVAAYKLALARLILAYQPRVTPSTFLLDTAGTLASPAAAEALAAARCCGLDAARQYTPLPPHLRSTPPGMAFRHRYDEYGTTVVRPFVAALRQCHALVVLADVTTLLAGGVGMYNDARAMLSELFAVLQPGEDLAGQAWRRLAKVVLPREYRPGGIVRVAFVAPKIDLVAPPDRDHVATLLHRLTGRIGEQYPGLHAAYFNVAAVASTTALGGADPRSLVGVPMRDASGARIAAGPEQRFTPSGVPAEWPRSWVAGDYGFPEVYPRMPARKDCPPAQVNLDAVFRFVTDL